MLTVDGAFDRIGSVLREKGYSVTKDEKAPDDSGDRVSVFTSPNMAVRVAWNGKARLLALQVDSAVDALVRKVGNEVGETSTDSD